MPALRAVAKRGVPLAAVFLAALFVYGYRVGDAPLDRTEPHRAVVAHQMVLSGDWLVPHLNGEVYLRKPPLIYWAEAASEKLTGRAEPWVWRLPSVLGSALCLAAVVAAWAGRWFGVGRPSGRRAWRCSRWCRCSTRTGRPTSTRSTRRRPWSRPCSRWS